MTFCMWLICWQMRAAQLYSYGFQYAGMADLRSLLRPIPIIDSIYLVMGSAII